MTRRGDAHNTPPGDQGDPSGVKPGTDGGGSQSTDPNGSVAREALGEGPPGSRGGQGGPTGRGMEAGPLGTAGQTGGPAAGDERGGLVPGQRRSFDEAIRPSDQISDRDVRKPQNLSEHAIPDHTRFERQPLQRGEAARTFAMEATPTGFSKPAVIETRNGDRQPFTMVKGQDGRPEYQSRDGTVYRMQGSQLRETDGRGNIREDGRSVEVRNIQFGRHPLNDAPVTPLRPQGTQGPQAMQGPRPSDAQAGSNAPRRQQYEQQASQSQQALRRQQERQERQDSPSSRAKQKEQDAQVEQRDRQQRRQREQQDRDEQTARDRKEARQQERVERRDERREERLEERRDERREERRQDRLESRQDKPAHQKPEQMEKPAHQKPERLDKPDGQDKPSDKAGKPGEKGEAGRRPDLIDKLEKPGGKPDGLRGAKPEFVPIKPEGKGGGGGGGGKPFEMGKPVDAKPAVPGPPDRGDRGDRGVGGGPLDKSGIPLTKLEGKLDPKLLDQLKDPKVIERLQQLFEKFQQGKPLEGAGRGLQDILKGLSPEQLKDLKGFLGGDRGDPRTIGLDKLDPKTQATLKDLLQALRGGKDGRLEGGIATRVLLDALGRRERDFGKIPTSDQTRTLLSDLTRLIGKDGNLADIITRNLGDRGLGAQGVMTELGPGKFVLKLDATPATMQELLSRLQKDMQPELAKALEATRRDLLKLLQDGDLIPRELAGRTTEAILQAQLAKVLEAAKLEGTLTPELAGKIAALEALKRQEEQLRLMEDGGEVSARQQESSQRMPGGDSLSTKTGDLLEKESDAEFEEDDDEAEKKKKLRAEELAALAEKKRRELLDKQEKERQEAEEKRKQMLLMQQKMRMRYRVVEGDTLLGIAKKMLYDATWAPLIFVINRSVIPLRMHKGKKYALPRVDSIIWLPSEFDKQQFKDGRAMLAPKDIEYGVPEFESAEDELAARFGENWAGEESPTERAHEAEEKRIKRLQNVQALLGEIPGRSARAETDKRIKYVVRLGDTLRSVAIKHPALNDVKLWKLVARVNNLPTETDLAGNPTVELKRGTQIRLPSNEEIEAFRQEEEEKRNFFETLAGSFQQPRAIECGSCNHPNIMTASLCTACGDGLSAVSVLVKSVSTPDLVQEATPMAKPADQVPAFLQSAMSRIRRASGSAKAVRVDQDFTPAASPVRELGPSHGAAGRSASTEGATGASAAASADPGSGEAKLQLRELISEAGQAASGDSGSSELEAPKTVPLANQDSPDVPIQEFPISDIARIALVGSFDNLEAGVRVELGTSVNGRWVPVVAYVFDLEGQWRESYAPGGKKSVQSITLPMDQARQLANNDLQRNWIQYIHDFRGSDRVDK